MFNSQFYNISYNNKLQYYLKLTYDFLKNKFKNYSHFWSVDNSLDVVNKLKGMNIPTSVQVFDFENLFCNIPIDLLYENILQLFNLSNIQEELKIDKGLFINLAHFCFFNNYITFQKKIYLQKHGIGMGTNYSSTDANLFLFFYEYKYTVNYNVNLNIFRYIDDTLILNSSFTEKYALIYPNCLNLKKSNEHDLHVDFLDISITIYNNSLQLNLYEKRKDFNFAVFSMLH